MLISATFVLRETLPPEERETGGLSGTLATYGKLLKDRLFMGYALSQGLVTAAMFAYISIAICIAKYIRGITTAI